MRLPCSNRRPTRRLAVLCLCALACRAGRGQVQDQPYTIRVSSDEISLRFHAADRDNRPLTQLQIRDLQLFDNDSLQQNIVLLKPLEDLPIRAGFLFDISASVLKDVWFYRSVVQLYASRILAQGVDKAFVTQFDTEPLTVQNWTDQPASITTGAASIGPRESRFDPLTAIFDSLYITCRDQFQAAQSETAGNFIVVFSDGEDDASHVYLSEAVDMCQRKHVSIYAFESGHSSEGHQALVSLSQQTGGRLFNHARREDIWKDLQTIEAEQKDQYFLVYKPTNFKADSSFHRLRLQSNITGAHIVARSGYYAFPNR
ncbi:VWA domain-containing protein [Silvibacterium acidisoli]|uniref:VWA domain-containing protein n=1 Tax=Acidobacteriaceae bacterium ZG23-2 TaxID=2883246 RepID=UPI00406BE472